MRLNSYNKTNIKEKILERKPTEYSLDKVYPASKINLLKPKHNILNKTGVSLEFIISNVGLSGTGCNKDYVVEISVKSNVDTTYLQGALFRLKYNKLALGTNIFSTVTFTRTSDFPNSSYGFVGGFDLNDSIVQFSIQNYSSTLNYTQITTTPKRLITIRIPVNNCKNLGNFKIDTFSNNTLTFFSNSPTTDDYNSYTNIIYGSNKAGFICQPDANQITSLPFNGGRGEILTITGCNFGNIKGNITMRNADNPSTSFIALDKYDIIDWTNTQIKINIPSSVDSGDLKGTTYNVHPVGSGSLNIKDAYGEIDPVPQYVKVNNSAINYSDGSVRKRNVYLFSENNVGEYRFKLHSNITNPKMKDCIKAALRRWSCTTGLPFVLDNVTSNNDIISDNINLIKLDNVNLNNLGLVLAQTSTRSVLSSLCIGNSSTIPFPVKEIDIAINDNYNKFKFDTTGTMNIEADSTDFFAVIMHEIGHGLCLDHTLNIDDIMYPSQRSGFQASQTRRIYIKDNDLDGANYIINNSLAIPTGMTCSFNKPIIKYTTNCLWNNALDEKSNGSIIIKVNPNPFSSEINIEFEAKNCGQAILNILDVTGKVIFGNYEQKVISGGNKIKIEQLNLNDGLYFINLNVDGKIINYKILCQK